MHWSIRRTMAVVAAGGLCLAGAATSASAAPRTPHHVTRYAVAAAPTAARNTGSVVTATPIKHLVVMFQENVSFDHYFGTYPNAANTDGHPFHAVPGTPGVNGLTPELLTHNPNENQPQRLTYQQPLTCDQDHDYTPEQQAMDGGLMDKFVQYTQVTSCSPPDQSVPGLVMDYYDGNTVTALWHYADHFAMSDNFFDTDFGPSTPGALNLASGNTYGATGVTAGGAVETTDPGVVGSPNSAGLGTDYGDQDPYYDNCSNRSGELLKMTGQNIGNLLDATGVSWGWFQGGFSPTKRMGGGFPVCGHAHKNVGGASVNDYVPHHDPFQYYASTANPNHLPPANLAEVGHNGQANHQYDISWFYKDLAAGHMPSVSFLKAPAYENGHAGYSDPLDEQHYLVKTINAIMASKFWNNTAIMITYDDSDGWYDHVMPPIVNPSADPALDALNGTGVCGNGTPLGGFEDRCGYGPRLPFLLISPYARTNYVSSSLADQTSILAFIENNWLHGERIGNGSFDALAGSLMNMFTFKHPVARPLFLSATTGELAR
jgi:phospholipase C